MSDYIVTLATPAEYELVGRLVHSLLAELLPSGSDAPDLKQYQRVSHDLLHDDNNYWAIVARLASEEVAGVITLNECFAIYAGGRVGWIPELYVKPQYRSKGVGKRLLAEADKFGRSRGWVRLEVSAPNVPRFQRTVEFYLGNGFLQTGPRLKREIR